MKLVLIATSNPGKLRDFAAAAAAQDAEVLPLPGFASLPAVVEDGETFEANARKKAAHYSRFAPGTMVLADDSGLEVAALGGAPGVQSARYATMRDAAASVGGNASDEANNQRLLREMERLVEPDRRARFVCALAAARDGLVLAVFRGQVEGTLLAAPRGSNGFGYDPLFFVPALACTLAELSAEDKARVSHRGQALRGFLDWWKRNPS